MLAPMKSMISSFNKASMRPSSMSLQTLATDLEARRDGIQGQRGWNLELVYWWYRCPPDWLQVLSSYSMSSVQRHLYRELTSREDWHEIWCNSTDVTTVQIQEIHVKERSQPAVGTMLPEEYATFWFHQMV
ncbi:hypothetical protein ARMSODRAFT_981937 [Armillaria solidipes]|uniref:Uncharacterized protein n=1 Tax=Armillaria solidipes TaxID=1076256 RepID=A0A2H3APW8_9AGAR|nr:hypothetical protein ARMSODRAFT_981937 [Armillaria solidipes]